MRRMSASVRISALSSSTTRIGSGSAGLADIIQDSGDLIDREGLLQIRMDPLRRQIVAHLFDGSGLTTVQDEGDGRTRLVYRGYRLANRGGSEVHVEQHRERTLQRQELPGMRDRK